MPYPVYQIPSAAGILWSSGTGPLQPLPGKYLCSKADADLILKAFIDAGVAATLENAVNLPGYAFQGLDPNSENQPWWIVSSIGGPAGFAVSVMWGPNDVNGGGVGNPGAWHGIGSNPQWAATAPPPPPPPPAPNSTGDPNAFFLTQGGGQGYTQSDRDRDAEVYRLVHAMAKAQGIS